MRVIGKQAYSTKCATANYVQLLGRLPDSIVNAS